MTIPHHPGVPARPALRSGGLLARWALVAALSAAPRAAMADDAAARAQKAFKASDFEGALVEYRALARDKPTPEVLLQIARCLDHLLKSNEAIVAYQHLLHSGASAAQVKDARERIAFLREYLARGATPAALAGYHIERGAALYKLELYREARTEFEGATRLLPDKPNGHRWLGLTLERLGDCKAAVASFETFLAIASSDDPRTAEVDDGIKRCTARPGGASETVAGARPVVDEPLGPRASEHEKKVKEHVDRGADLFAAGRLKEAREEFAVARTLAPEKVTPFRWLGLVDALLDRCSDAVPNLEVFLKRVPASDPRVPEVREVLVTCLDRISQGKGGAVAASPASPTSPVVKAPPAAPAGDLESRARTALEKGMRLYRQASYREARDAFEEARALLPDRANAYRWLGLAEARLGHCREAVASFDTFIERVPADDDRLTEVARARGRCLREAEGNVASGTREAGSGGRDAGGPRRGDREPLPPTTPAPAADLDAPRPSAPATQAPPEPAQPDSPPERRHSLPSYTVPLAIGAGAVAVLAVGGGVTGWGVSDFYAAANSCKPNCTPEQSNPVRDKLYAGYAILGLGGAAAIGDAVLWYFWWRDRGARQPQARVVPTANGMAVSGAF